MSSCTAVWSSGSRCLLDVGDDVVGMVGDIGDVVGTMDQTVRVDQVAVAPGEFGELFAGVPRDLVRGTDRVVEIAQESERELLYPGERKVLSWGVERCAEDGRVEFVESFGAVTQRLAFDGSTRCRRFGIPPQQHPSAGEVRQVDGLVVLVGERERWCWLAWVEHGSILPVSVFVPSSGRSWLMARQPSAMCGSTVMSGSFGPVNSLVSIVSSSLGPVPGCG
jgi:hypothetical protein